jgi:UDP-N-acetylmuramoyl-L-alanyl-D-glutamate--2,6-diaminopimelate ligase
MKQLKDLLQGVTVLQAIECDAETDASDVQITSLTLDSRRVEAGSCFFAIEGATVDGHAFIGKAVEAGASAVVCKHIPEGVTTDHCTFIVTDDTDKAVAVMAENFYNRPSRRIKVVGVTGTNGKTTIATLLYDLVRALGHKAGLISTVVYKIDEREICSTHTTPDAIRLAEMMHEMAECGCEYCFMECSSHAIVQRRIYGVEFAGALFTNLTHDHLDYHHTFAEYVRAKKLFFDELPKSAFALVNADDRNGEVMLQNTRARRHTLSLRSMADFRCKIIETTLEGMELRIGNREVWVNLLGRFNAYNMLTVYGAARLLGFDEEDVLCAMSTLRSVSGRLEFVRAKDSTTAIIDYAHTPDALENVLRTIHEFRRGTSRIITICGCGGDRDRTKRPEMASIAVKYSDLAIFTSDNPRTESPSAILHDMEEGIEAGSRYMKFEERAEAIKTAVMLSAPGDILLVAGKGHENYQIVGTERLPFNDREQVEKWFSTFGR